jgi:hypothetical protein
MEEGYLLREEPKEEKNLLFPPSLSSKDNQILIKYLEETLRATSLLFFVFYYLLKFIT